VGPSALIADAVAALERGELVVLPTETVYGIACLQRSVERLRRAKGREPDKPFQVLVASVADALRVATIPKNLERLLPGPLTLVVSARGGGTIGLRVPAHPVAHDLLVAAGPLVASSANRAGQPTPMTIEGVQAVFGDEVAVYLTGEPAPSGIPSTVVDVTGDEPLVLREGAVPAARVEAALRGW
jgi:tRNA threonylcarbamoyl adenosine modification protein (Sua5/YciO/YrdC/YwlC family)